MYGPIGQGKRVQHVDPTSSNIWIWIQQLDKKCWMHLRTMLDDVEPTFFS